MTIDVFFGFWLIPFAITVGVYTWALMTPGYHFSLRNYQDIGIDFLPTLRLGLATIVSLAAWLVWALVSNA